MPPRHHARPHRLHVGVGQQVEHAEPLRLPRRRGEILDGLRIVDVASLCDVRHREVVGDEELERRRGGARQVEAPSELLDERYPLRHVPVALGLADVVKQHAQHQQIGPLDLAEHLGRAFRFGRLARRQRLEVLDGEKRVLVRRELVVGVVLDEARQRTELGEIPAEKPQLVHLP